MMKHSTISDRIRVLVQDVELGAVARTALAAGPDSAAWYIVERDLAAREAAHALALHTGTCETMSLMHWTADVIGEARVTDADARRFAQTELYAWFRGGAEAPPRYRC